MSELSKPNQDMDSKPIQDTLDSNTPIQDMDTRQPVASEEDIAKLFTEFLPQKEL